MLIEYVYHTSDLVASWGPTNRMFPMKYHQNVEICLVLKGEAVLILKDGEHMLKPGDMYVIFPNVPHAVNMINARNKLLMFNPELIPGLTEILLSRKPKCPVLRAGEVTALNSVLFNRAIQLYFQDRVFYRPVILSHAASLMHEIMISLELTNRSTARRLPQNLADFMLEHACGDVTLEIAAKKLGYSKFYLSRVIPEMFGCNFRTLVNHYRISAAQEKLRSSKKTISEICFECGFQNLSTFNRAFMKMCGMTPTEYRKIWHD